MKPFCDITCEKKKDQIFWLFLLSFDSKHDIGYKKLKQLAFWNLSKILLLFNIVNLKKAIKTIH